MRQASRRPRGSHKTMGEMCPDETETGAVRCEALQANRPPHPVPFELEGGSRLHELVCAAIIGIVLASDLGSVGQDLRREK